MPDFLPHWALILCAWVGLASLVSTALLVAMALLAQLDDDDMRFLP